MDRPAGLGGKALVQKGIKMKLLPTLDIRRVASTSYHSEGTPNIGFIFSRKLKPREDLALWRLFLFRLGQ